MTVYNYSTQYNREQFW